MFNALRDAALPDTLRVHRAEIAHRGKLGLLSIEGVGRNPRIDDLQTLIYDPAIEDDAIAAWLEEVKSTREDCVGSGGLVNLSFLSEEGDSRASVRTVGATVVLGADYGWQIRIPPRTKSPATPSKSDCTPCSRYVLIRNGSRSTRKLAHAEQKRDGKVGRTVFGRQERAGCPRGRPGGSVAA